MKRWVIAIAVGSLVMVALVFVLVCGVSFSASKIMMFYSRSFQYSHIPGGQPMTEWESYDTIPEMDVTVYLYVPDRTSGTLIYRDANGEKTYFLKFIPGAYLFIYENDITEFENDEIESVVSYTMSATSSTTCKLYNASSVEDWPEYIFLRRVDIDLDS